MSTGTLLSVEEYLKTSYRPDCDYVDGEVLERNMGEMSHGRLQLLVASWLGAREKQWRVKVAVEVRLRIRDKRFRIPDVMVISAEAPHEEVVATPPLLCIEILSQTDSLNRIWERTQDYFSIGVPVCWILDPIARRGWIVTADGLVEAREGVLRAGEVELRLADVLE